jgi:hypothetical protein
MTPWENENQMKVFKGKQTGKTTKLIEMASESGDYIVVANTQRADFVFKKAKEMNKVIHLPITFDEFVQGRYGSMITGFLIDDVDQIMQMISRVPVNAITLD